MARLAAALICGKGIPSEIQDQGITADPLSPARFAAGNMRAALPN
jgi:hypothetical protein